MGALDRLRAYRLSPWGRTWLGRGVALVGFGLLAKVLLEVGIVGLGGPGGTDANDYWIAAQHAAHGEPLYAEQYGSFLAYSYPPVFAQVLSLFTWLPHGPFIWLWRAVELGALRVAVGSWTRAGIALLFPPVISEIETGNVHLVMAAVCALAMRGVATPVVPAALLKFASLPLVPIAFLRDRRGLLVGAGVAVAAVGVSYILAPRYWSDYFAFLSASGLPNVPAVALTIVPLPLRLVLAGALGIAAIRFARLAPIAVVLAYPVVWATSLSTLVAVAAPLPSSAPTVERRLSLPWRSRPAEPDPVAVTR